MRSLSEIETAVKRASRADGFSWGIVGGIIALMMVINLLLKSKFLEKFITTDSNVSNLKKNYKKRGKV